jgi:hypothetical protein
VFFSQPATLPRSVLVLVLMLVLVLVLVLMSVLVSANNRHTGPAPIPALLRGCSARFRTVRQGALSRS